MKLQVTLSSHAKVLTLVFLTNVILGILNLSGYFYFPKGKFNGSWVREICKLVPNNPNGTKVVDQGIWTILPAGRMGNQMGEYATLYALAKLNGQKAYIKPSMFNTLAPVFKITLPQLHDSVAQKTHFKLYTLDNWMKDKYKHIGHNYVKLYGYPWSWTFYHHIRDEILQEFTFHDFIREEINKYLETLKGSLKNVTYIGVHVRRGDYVHVMPKAWKGVVADKAYMDKAMAYFRNKYKEPVFVVVSNGMQWCKENLDASNGDVYFTGDGNESLPGMDFAILAHCNHTIMTIGSFGFWAAYLVGGETVYLNNFTLPGSAHARIFHYESIYLPSWIGISADLSPLRNTTLSRNV